METLILLVAGAAAGAFLLWILLFRSKKQPPRPRTFEERTRAKVSGAYVDLSAVAFRPRVNVSREKYATGGFGLVGESFHQDALRALMTSTSDDFEALLVPEPENPYDPNAVLVMADGFGPIGHFSREDAERYTGMSRLLHANGAVGTCHGWLRGGTSDTPSIGAFVSPVAPKRALKLVKEGLTAPSPPSAGTAAP